LKKTSEYGKPGESRGRKANGSNVTPVTMIARPPKMMYKLFFAQAWVPQALCFLPESFHIRLFVR
jgi:hypothetical protein